MRLAWALLVANAATFPMESISSLTLPNRGHLLDNEARPAIKSPLETRHAGPMSLHQHITNGIVKVRETLPDAELLEVYSRAQDSGGWDESDDEDFYNPLKFNIISITFRAHDADDPERMEHRYITSEGLGHWNDRIGFGSPTGFVTNVVLNWQAMPKGHTLAQAVSDLGLINPQIETDVRHFRIFARPNSGYDCEGKWCLASRLLSEAIPGGIYYEFTLWDQRFIRFIYIDVANGDIYVDPKPGNNGIFHPRLVPSPGSRSVEDVD